MHRPTLLVAALLLSASANLPAQAPVITPKGDPSVRSDTIYKLASDSASFPEEQVLVLLDDGVVRLEADGRGTRTYRQVVQILREGAVEGYQEHSLSWVPGRQKLTVNWFKVVGLDGKVISDKPAQIQDSDVPADMVDPVYSDQRIRRLSLAGVGVGTIVDYSYTIEDVKPFPPDDYYSSWGVSMGASVRRSRLILDVPAAVKPALLEKNLNFKRTESAAKGRRVYTWATGDIPRVKRELYAADSNDVYMSVSYALPRTWAAVGNWYGSLTKDSYKLGPAVRSKIAEVVAGAKTREDSLRALHRWVAQDIRYVSVSLGTGGYQPRLPDEVLKTGFGDCKDKATIFVAALRSWGIGAHPVVLNTGPVERSLPTVLQFNHVIAAIDEPSGGYRYVDLTASHTPWGELPYGPQGEFALVVREDGRVDEVTIPMEDVAKNSKMIRIIGELTSDGIFSGRYEENGLGLQQYSMREAFETPLDSTQRANVMRSLASNIYPGASGDSLTVSLGKDLSVTPNFSMVLKGGRAATRSGDMVILSLTTNNMESLATLAEQIESQGPRRFTIDAESVFGPMATESETRITLPEGWRARLPKNINATSEFGEFHSEYAQEGRVLVIRRRVLGARGVHAPEKISRLTGWLREVAQENTRFIVIDPKA